MISPSAHRGGRPRSTGVTRCLPGWLRSIEMIRKHPGAAPLNRAGAAFHFLTMADDPTHVLRRLFSWIWPGDGKKPASEGRGLLVRILIIVIWVPIQITLSLIFATGGMFFVLIFGIILAPFAGLFFLVRHMVRGPGDETEAEDLPSQDDHGDTQP